MSKRKSHSTPIERRLFKIAVILAVSVTGFWVLFGLWAGYQWPVMSIYCIAVVFYSFILWRLLKGAYHPSLVNAYFYFGAFLLSLGWFPSGGIRGSIIHLFILIYFAGLLTLAPRGYLIFVCVMILLVATFVTIELNHPELAAPYTDQTQLITDIAIGNILIMIISGFAFFVFKKEYLKDQMRIKKLNKYLEDEKIKAQTADRTKSQFLTTISHEMRTPLSGIVGITDLLSRTELNQEQTELVTNLSNSSSLLHSLISDVLDLSEIESGQLILHESSFNIQEEVNLIMEIFLAGLKSKNKELELTFEHDDRIQQYIKGDLLRLKQILINLINNAVKFTDKGFVKVISKLQDQNSDTITVKFIIEDSGTGIAQEHQDQLFNKFYKARQPLGASIPGSGLGLSISKNLVELMGGEIRMVSEQGIGSTFSFDVIFKKTGHSPPKTNTDENKISSGFEHLEVLLVEDVTINQMVIKKMLSNIKIINIDLAENGVEAVEKGKAKAYDLVLMDIQMPRMGGLEATRQLLIHYEQEQKDRPYIFALTANATKEDIESCMAVGMDHFISKPFTQKALNDAMDEFFQ